MSLLLAQSGQHNRTEQRPLLGVKRISAGRSAKFDKKPSNHQGILGRPRPGSLLLMTLVSGWMEADRIFKLVSAPLAGPYVPNAAVVYMLGPFWRDNSGIALRTLGA